MPKELLQYHLLDLIRLYLIHYTNISQTSFTCLRDGCGDAASEAQGLEPQLLLLWRVRDNLKELEQDGEGERLHVRHSRSGHSKGKSLALCCQQMRLEECFFEVHLQPPATGHRRVIQTEAISRAHIHSANLTTDHRRAVEGTSRHHTPADNQRLQPPVGRETWPRKQLFTATK